MIRRSPATSAPRTLLAGAGLSSIASTGCCCWFVSWLCSSCCSLAGLSKPFCILGSRWAIRPGLLLSRCYYGVAAFQNNLQRRAALHRTAWLCPKKVLVGPRLLSRGAPGPSQPLEPLGTVRTCSFVLRTPRSLVSRRTELYVLLCPKRVHGTAI